MKMARLPPPFPAGAPHAVKAPPAPPASTDDIVDLSDDLNEELVEEFGNENVTVAAPRAGLGPLPPRPSTAPVPIAPAAAPEEKPPAAAPAEPVRQRRKTLRSAISAQLAESMVPSDDASPTVIATPETSAGGGVVETTMPHDAELTVSVQTFATPAEAARLSEEVRGRAAAPVAPAPARRTDDEATPMSRESAVLLALRAEPAHENAAVPTVSIHDDITVQLPTERPRAPTPPSGTWVELVAEPEQSVPTWVPPPVTIPPPALRSFDLRGVFPSDGAAIASDRMLPDEVFVSRPGARARGASVPSSWLAPLSHGGGSNASAGADPAPGSPSLAATAVPRPARRRTGRLGRLPDPGSAAHRVSARRPREETLPRGAIIDKYRIERLLGKGGFAAVYRATHLLLNTHVAIKLLRPQILAKHAHLAKLLYEEARFAARIDHPNVVKVFDVTHSASITYIVMEYIDGRSLADTIARERAMPWRRVVEIGLAVATGLKVALEAHLIHRDIKPANILLSRRGEIKIVDLGLGLRAGGIPAQAESEPTPGRRSAIGTFGYMAPEQAVDPERVDFRADIYALGATLYEAAVGAPPFPLGDPARCLEMHAREPPPPPESRRPGLPPALSALLLRMLAKKADDRFSSYDALIEALRQVALLPTSSGA